MPQRTLEAQRPKSGEWHVPDPLHLVMCQLLDPTGYDEIDRSWGLTLMGHVSTAFESDESRAAVVGYTYVAVPHDKSWPEAYAEIGQEADRHSCDGILAPGVNFMGQRITMGVLFPMESSRPLVVACSKMEEFDSWFRITVTYDEREEQLMRERQERGLCRLCGERTPFLSRLFGATQHRDCNDLVE